MLAEEKTAAFSGKSDGVSVSSGVVTVVLSFVVISSSVFLLQPVNKQEMRIAAKSNHDAKRFIKNLAYNILSPYILQESEPKDNRKRYLFTKKLRTHPPFWRAAKRC